MRVTRQSAQATSQAGAAEPAAQQQQQLLKQPHEAANQQHHCRVTRQQAAAQQAQPCNLQGRKRRRNRSANAEQQQPQLRQEQQQHEQQQPDTKKRRLGVRELAYTVIRAPNDPRAVYKVLPLLEALMKAEQLSNKHWRYTAAVYKLADEAPVPLMQALLARTSALQHLLDLLSCSHQYIAQNAALALLVLLRTVAAVVEPAAGAAAGAAGEQADAGDVAAGEVGHAEAAAAAAAVAAEAAPAGNAAPPLLQELAAAVHEAVVNADMAEADLAAEAEGHEAHVDVLLQGQAAAVSQQAAMSLLQPLLDALLAEQHAGLLRLLQAMHSSSKVISVLMATGICIFAQAVHTRLGTPETGAALMDAMLARQQQGLSLVLQALHHERYPDAAANLLRCLAHAAPARLLDALLSQQRRGLQSLLRCLDAPSEHASVCSRTAVLLLLQAAEGRPRQLLVRMLMRALQQGSFGAGQLVLSFSQMPAGPVLLRQHIKVLLQLVAVQAPCQTLVAASLWSVANHSEASVEALAAFNPQPLLQAMMLGGDPATLAAGTVCLLALSDMGRCSLLPYIPDLLSLVAPQHSSLVCSMAMRTISLISAPGAPDWAQQAVLQHISGLLAAMSQKAHPDAAAAAGNVLLSLVHMPTGLHALCSDQHVDALIAVLESRGPATTHAARAVAQLASGVPAVRLLLVTPHRQAVLGGLQDILQELLLADAEFVADPFQAYQLLAPVYWSCVASAACQMVPAFLADLVACMQRPELTLPAFEGVAYLTGFPAGLLGLAPHVRQVWRAVSAPHLLGDAALQAYLSSIVAAVQASVQRLQQEAEDVRARRSHAAQMLAALHAQHRKRPRARGPLGKEVLLWLRCVARLQERSEQLQQQLAVALVAL